MLASEYCIHTEFVQDKLLISQCVTAEDQMSNTKENFFGNMEMISFVVSLRLFIPLVDRAC